MQEKVQKRAKKQEPAKQNASLVTKSTHKNLNNSLAGQIFSLQRTLGNRAVQQLFESGAVQLVQKNSNEKNIPKKVSDPVRLFGFSNDDIQSVGDLDRVENVLKHSKIFMRALSIIKNKNINVSVGIANLPEKAGGGRCYGSGRVYGVSIDPEDIAPGIHVVDIYIHEFGHVWEDHDGPSADYFTNQVQKELGIRQTKPTHTPLSTPRDPFAKPGSKDNP